MARARLKMTGKATKRAQPVCVKCGKTIEPGQMRYEWSFRYGGTYRRHQECGAPRPSELTQGRVGELYAAQEAIEDALGADRGDFDSWRDEVVAQLESAAEVATDLGGEYTEAAEHFGGEGENAERAQACETWAESLSDAASTIQDITLDEDEKDEDAEPDADEDEDDGDDPRETAEGEVESAAEDAIGELEL